jgi:hypothetical protein
VSESIRPTATERWVRDGDGWTEGSGESRSPEPFGGLSESGGGFGDEGLGRSGEVEEGEMLGAGGVTVGATVTVGLAASTSEDGVSAASGDGGEFPLSIRD